MRNVVAAGLLALAAAPVSLASRGAPEIATDSSAVPPAARVARHALVEIEIITGHEHWDQLIRRLTERRDVRKPEPIYV